MASDLAELQALRDSITSGSNIDSLPSSSSTPRPQAQSSSQAMLPSAPSSVVSSLVSRPESRALPVSSDEGKGKATIANDLRRPGLIRKEEKKLYVGNLAPSCDEYTLVQLYSRYGKIVKLEYLFHTSGPLKGKPRGFAFVEFETTEEALTALVETNDKLIRGRKLIVSMSNTAPTIPDGRNSARKRKSDLPKPTLLSIQKKVHTPSSTDAKIRALEAKLSKMKESSTVVPRPGEQGSSLTAAPSTVGLPMRPSQTYKPPSLTESALMREEVIRK